MESASSVYARQLSLPTLTEIDHVRGPGSCSGSRADREKSRGCGSADPRGGRERTEHEGTDRHPAEDVGDFRHRVFHGAQGELPCLAVVLGSDEMVPCPPVHLDRERARRILTVGGPVLDREQYRGGVVHRVTVMDGEASLASRVRPVDEAPAWPGSGILNPVEDRMDLDDVLRGVVDDVGDPGAADVTEVLLRHACKQAVEPVEVLRQVLHLPGMASIHRVAHRAFRDALLRESEHRGERLAAPVAHGIRVGARFRPNLRVRDDLVSRDHLHDRRVDLLGALDGTDDVPRARRGPRDGPGDRAFFGPDHLAVARDARRLVPVGWRPVLLDAHRHPQDLFGLVDHLGHEVRRSKHEVRGRSRGHVRSVGRERELVVWHQSTSLV